MWLSPSGCAQHAPIVVHPDTAIFGESDGFTDSPTSSYLASSGPDSSRFVDPVASFQGRLGSGVVFGGYANDAVAQVFTVSLGGKLVSIDVYVVSYPPGSPPREFKWFLRDAARFDSDNPNVQSLPVLASGASSSEESRSLYSAPPCRIELPSLIQLQPGQVLLLETRPMTEEPIVWNGGFGTVPGATYWCQDGSWSKIRGSATRALGRVVWMVSG